MFIRKQVSLNWIFKHYFKLPFLYFSLSISFLTFPTPLIGKGSVIQSKVVKLSQLYPVMKNSSGAKNWGILMALTTKKLLIYPRKYKINALKEWTFTLIILEALSMMLLWKT